MEHLAGFLNSVPALDPCLGLSIQDSCGRSLDMVAMVSIACTNCSFVEIEVKNVRCLKDTMTHILVNPGYSLKHGRARTVNDNAALERQKHNWRKLSESELNHIRSESRLKWLAAWEDPGKPVVKSVYDWESTYSRQHDFKKLDQPTESRPTSPTRRNNPHPPG